MKIHVEPATTTLDSPPTHTVASELLQHWEQEYSTQNPNFAASCIEDTSRPIPFLQHVKDALRATGMMVIYSLGAFTISLPSAIILAGNDSQTFAIAIKEVKVEDWSSAFPWIIRLSRHLNMVIVAGLTIPVFFTAVHWELYAQSIMSLRPCLRRNAWISVGFTAVVVGMWPILVVLMDGNAYFATGWYELVIPLVVVSWCITTTCLFSRAVKSKSVGYWISGYIMVGLIWYMVLIQTISYVLPYLNSSELTLLRTFGLAPAAAIGVGLSKFFAIRIQYARLPSLHWALYTSSSLMYQTGRVLMALQPLSDMVWSCALLTILDIIWKLAVRHRNEFYWRLRGVEVTGDKRRRAMLNFNTSNLTDNTAECTAILLAGWSILMVLVHRDIPGVSPRHVLSNIALQLGVDWVGYFLQSVLLSKFLHLPVHKMTAYVQGKYRRHLIFYALSTWWTVGISNNISFIGMVVKDRFP